MSLFKEVFSGYAQRIRLENHLKLEAAKLERPAQVKLQVAATLTTIDKELAADPVLKARYDGITINVPT